MFYDRRSCDSEKLNNSLSSFINKSWWLIKGSQQHRSTTWARSESKSNHNQIIVVSTHSHSTFKLIWCLSSRYYLSHNFTSIYYLLSAVVSISVNHNSTLEFNWTLQWILVQQFLKTPSYLHFVFDVWCLFFPPRSTDIHNGLSFFNLTS